jgi:hypothetical protein
MKFDTRMGLLVVAAVFASQGAANGSILEQGDLNIIVQPGNPSDGLRYLDLSYSDAKTLPDALLNAQATYPNARLATVSEWVDFFSAAGIIYDGPWTIAAAFEPGSTLVISSGTNYNQVIRLSLGITGGNPITSPTYFWSDPDGSNDPLTTRDYVSLSGPGGDIKAVQIVPVPPDVDLGWLLVSEVPEPTTLVIWSLLATLGLSFGWRRRRRA